MVKDLCTAYDGVAGLTAVGRPPHPAAGGAPCGGTDVGLRAAEKALSVGPAQSPRPCHTAVSPGQGERMCAGNARTLTCPWRVGCRPGCSRGGRASPWTPVASAATDNAPYRL